MSKYDYNIIVIGAGAAGLVSAYIASATKAKVALIESEKMGGDCLNTGCVPSKALIHTAKIFHTLNQAQQYGFSSTEANIDFSTVMRRVQQKIDAIEPHDSIERYTKLGVNCYTGHAFIKDGHTVTIDGKTTITARAIIVATGASPIIPPIKGLEDVPYITSNTLWQLKTLPKRLLVLGAGAIGCELSQAFSRLGTNVTLVEIADRLLPNEDIVTSKHIERTFIQENITLLLQHKALSFSSETSQPLIHLETEDNQKKSIPFDTVLLALGRKPNVEGFGLQEIGVLLKERGFIDASPFLRTNIPSIYVCGDVAGPYQFTHMAAHQAWYASVNALFSPFVKFKVDYSVVPRCTFTSPQVAHVGLTELQAKSKNIPYKTYNYDMSDLDRAIVDDTNNGFIQVICPPKKDNILGATIVHEHAGEMINEYIFAMKHKLRLKHILQTPHIYPTYHEGNKYLAGKWKMDNTPNYIYQILKKFHRFRQ